MTRTNSTHRPPRSRRRPAFTLVELLVVIGIIALLISILLPALNAARRQATAVKCLAQFRSIGQAVGIYAVQYKGTLPGPASEGCKPWYRDDGTNSTTFTRLYLSSYLAKTMGFAFPDKEWRLNPTFVCPAYPGDASELGALATEPPVLWMTPRYVSPRDPNYGTALATPLFALGRPDTSTYKNLSKSDPMPSKITRLKNSAEVPILREIDNENRSINIFSGGAWPTNWYVLKAPQHGRKGKIAMRNVLYADGHAVTQMETP